MVSMLGLGAVRPQPRGQAAIRACQRKGRFGGWPGRLPSAGAAVAVARVVAGLWRGRASREPACQSAPACRLFAGPASGIVCARALCIAVTIGSVDALSSVHRHKVIPGGAGQRSSSLCLGAEKPMGLQAAVTPVLKHLYDALVRQMRQIAQQEVLDGNTLNTALLQPLGTRMKHAE